MFAAFSVGAILLAQASALKEEINLGACFGYFNQMGAYSLMAKLALDEGYFDDLLPDNAKSDRFTIKLTAVNTECSGSISTLKALPLLLGQGNQEGFIYSTTETRQPVVGIAGCTCSGATMPVSTMTTNYKVPMVSGSATNPDLSNKGLYPYFARVVPPDSMQGNAIAGLIVEFGWKRVLVAYPAEPYGMGIAGAFKSALGSTDVTVLEYQLQFQPLSEPEHAADFDHAAWSALALQAAQEFPQPRIILGLSVQLDHVVRIFADIGLVTADTVWLMNEGTCAVGLLSRVGLKQADYQAEDPTDTWWDYDWMKIPVMLKGMMCFTPRSIGAKYYTPRFQDFFATVTKAKLEALGWNSTEDGWDDEWLTPSFFEGLIYNPLAFDALAPFIYVIGKMLGWGVAAADIKGDALHLNLMNSTFESITGPIGFDENGDRLAPYNIWNLLVDANDIPTLVTVGEYDGITGTITWSRDPVFGDGTTNVPADRPEACQAGSEYGGTFEGCVDCVPGRASVAVDSRCIACLPGYYQSASGSSACKFAPKGSSVNGTSASDFIKCPLGQFASDRGSTACKLCVAGTFASMDGMSACDQAPSGSFVALGGADSAEECAPGSSAMEPGAIACTRCLAGFFQNLTGQEMCIPAPSGSFVALVGADSAEECAQGSSAMEPGAIACTRCLAGFFQNLMGQDMCIRCEKGSFSLAGSASCTQCSSGMTTESAASALPTDCQCPEGEYCHTTPPKTYQAGECECKPCLEGMTCPFGAKAEALVIGYTGSEPAPQVQPGFYTSDSEPLSVYLCHPSKGRDVCPGGPPQTCLNSLKGLTCASCESGYAKKGDDCEKCSEGNMAVLIFVPIFALIGCILVYYMGNRQVETNSTIFLGVSVVAGLIVTVMQLFATFDQLTLPWPGGIKGFFGATKPFVFNPGALSADCLDGEPTSQYVLRFILPYLVVAAMLLCFGIAKALAVSNLLKADWQWDGNKALNSVFQIYQAIFIALTAISAVPFQCYTHPNGERSLVQYPTMLCGSSGHRSMIIMSVILIITFVLPFIGVQLWANYHVIRVRGNAASRTRHLTQFRFLMYRFRPDVWWWGIVFSIRQTLLAFAPMIEPDDPHAQSVFIIGVLVVYTANVCYFWPWKVDELNLLDAISLVLIVMIVAAVSSFMPASEWKDGHSAMMVAMLVILAVAGFCGVFFSVVRVFRTGKFDLSGFFGSDEQRLKSPKRITQLTKDLYDLANILGRVPSAELVEALLSMNSYDIRKVRGAIDSFKVSTVESIAGSQARLPYRLVGVPHSSSSGALGAVTRTQAESIGKEVESFKPARLAAAII